MALNKDEGFRNENPISFLSEKKTPFYLIFPMSQTGCEGKDKGMSPEILLPNCPFKFFLHLPLKYLSPITLRNWTGGGMDPGSTWDDSSSYSQQNLFGCIHQLHQILYDPPKSPIIELLSSYLGLLHHGVPREIPGSEQNRTGNGRETGTRGWDFAPELPSPFQPLCNLISRGGKKNSAGSAGRLPDPTRWASPSRIENRVWAPAASASPASCLHGQKWEC